MNFDSPVLSSTLLLTILSLIGLFFFIRASVKDRTQTLQIISQQSEDDLLKKLKNYFQQRSYQVVAIDAQQNQVTLEGFVQASLFLAIFLTILALIGFLCLGLVLSILFPNFGSIGFIFVIFSPLAGFFYWQKAGRIEKVVFKIDSGISSEQIPECRLTVIGHRDELKGLQEILES